MENFNPHALLKYLTMVVFCSGCFAKFTVNVDKSEIYVLPSWNKTIKFKVQSDSKERINLIRLEIVGEIMRTLHKMEIKYFENGTIAELAKKSFDQTEDAVLYYLKDRTNITFDQKLSEITFNITNIIEKDIGLKYKLSVESDNDLLPYSNEVTLVRIEKPKIVKSKATEKVYIKAGNSFSDICRATGKPKPTVKWIIKSRGNITTSTKNDGDYQSAELRIFNFQKDQTQSYECIAENIGGSDKKILELYAAYLNYQDGSSPGTLSTPVGGTIDPECKIDGFPIVKYEWRDPSGDVIDSTKRLYLYNIKDNQFGNYTCVATTAEVKDLKLTYSLIVKQRKEIIQEPQIGASNFASSLPVDSPLCLLASLLSFLFCIYFK